MSFGKALTPLPEIKSLLAGITQGDWWNESHSIKAKPKGWPLHVATAINMQQYPGVGEKNAAFIAAAPQLVSELVERVEDLQRSLEKIAGMAGAPDSATACRNIIREVKELEKRK